LLDEATDITIDTTNDTPIAAPTGIDAQAATYSDVLMLAAPNQEPFRTTNQ
jgi:hypothetical protein